MSVANGSPMDKKRFAALVEAYGANPSRWPVSERRAAEQLLASSVAARAAVDEAEQLGRMLLKVGQIEVLLYTQNRLLADFDRGSQRSAFQRVIHSTAEFIWPGVPVWQPAVAFAAALAVGLGIAVVMPLDAAQMGDVSVGIFALDDAPDLASGLGT